jgi:hypothetical protein
MRRHRTTSPQPENEHVYSSIVTRDNDDDREESYRRYEPVEGKRDFVFATIDDETSREPVSFTKLENVVFNIIIFFGMFMDLDVREAIRYFKRNLYSQFYGLNESPRSSKTRRPVRPWFNRSMLSKFVKKMLMMSVVLLAFMTCACVILFSHGEIGRGMNLCTRHMDADGLISGEYWRCMSPHLLRAIPPPHNEMFGLVGITFMLALTLAGTCHTLGKTQVQINNLHQNHVKKYRRELHKWFNHNFTIIDPQVNIPQNPPPHDRSFSIWLIVFAILICIPAVTIIMLHQDLIFGNTVIKENIHTIVFICIEFMIAFVYTSVTSVTISLQDHRHKAEKDIHDLVLNLFVKTKKNTRCSTTMISNGDECYRVFITEIWDEDESNKLRLIFKDQTSQFHLLTDELIRV